MYQMRILDEAARDLERLDKPVAQRVVDRIRWLTANLETYAPKPLSGDLSHLYKLRAGDYRILYEILHDEETVVVHAVGHRSKVYRKR